MRARDVRELPDGAELGADVCLIGSGPAGITLARELSGSGASVLLLESGGVAPDAFADGLNEIESVGVARVMNQTLVRNRGLGGSSATWWGRLAVFDEMDFAERPWVPHSGWPLRRDALRPYFARAAAHLGGTVADNTDPAVTDLVARLLPGLDPALLVPYAWTLGRHDPTSKDAPRYGAKALEEELPGVECLLHATVVSIGLDGGRVGRVEVRSSDGTARSVRASTVVLCAGGIENARLLLASNGGAGIGDEHGLVGRFLLDHPRGTVATFAPEDSLRVQRVLNEVRPRVGGHPTTVIPGLALSPTAQRERGLLNCAVWVLGDVGPGDPVDAARSLVRGRRPLASAASLARHPVLLAEGVWRAGLRRRAAVRVMPELTVQAIVEQRPDAESRVTLSPRRDALGVPLSVLDWRVSRQEADTVRATVRAVGDELGRLGLPRPRPLPWVLDPAEPLRLPDVAHPTGTTRMSADPREGVVDTDCRVHGVEGLYVAGSSVFPTSGHANPTQMIVALAVRLADHLRTR